MARTKTTTNPNGDIAAKGGFGKITGKGGMKRFRKGVNKENMITCFTKPAIRRLGYRAGIKRIGAKVYNEVRKDARTYMEKVLEKAIVFVENSRKKTVSTKALKAGASSIGKRLYI